MKNATNKKGMTLVELLVYIALASLLLAPIIVLMNNSSRNMARDAASTDMRISGRDIVGIMYDDIKNTGFKLNFTNAGTVTPMDDVVTYQQISGWTSPSGKRQDSSSFDLRNGKGAVTQAFDTLTIRKGRLNDVGTWVGHDVISYFVDDTNMTTDPAAPGKTVCTGKLKRVVKTVNTSGSIISDETMILAENVEALQFSAIVRSDISTSTSPCPSLFNFTNTWMDSLPAPGNAFSYEQPTSSASALDNCTAFKKKNARYLKAVVFLRHGTQKGTTRISPQITIKTNESDKEGVPLWPASVMRERYEIEIPIPNNGLFP